MGIKRLKEKYDIGHQIAIMDDKICIGSGYIPNLIEISLNGELLKRYDKGNWSANADLSRYQQEIDADAETGELKRLIETPDTYDHLHKVYTTDESKGVILKYCEEFGYPNTTTDGEKMYENTFFQTEEEARDYLKSETRLAVKFSWRITKEKFADFIKFIKILATDLFNFAKARIFKTVTEQK